MNKGCRVCLFAVLVLGLLLSSYATSQAGEAAAADKPVVYFGIIPRYNPMIMYRNYQPIMDYLTEHTSYRFELKLSRDYTEAVKLMRTGVTPIASLGDVTFIEAFHAFAAMPILRPLNQEGKPYYRSIIIVAENSAIRSLQDLRGKSFAFGDAHSTSGNLIPRNYLFRHGITLFDFGRHDNLDSHDAVVKAVLKGKFDAGAVKDVMAKHYQSHGLRFLASSDPIPSVPIVVRPDASPQLIAEVQRALLAIDPGDAQMATRMESWDPEFRYGFVPASLDDYQEIIEMMDAVRLGCGVRCH